MNIKSDFWINFWKDFLKFSYLLVEPTIIASICTFIWYKLNPILAVPFEDVQLFEPLLGGIVGAHLFLAALQIQKISEQENKIKQAKILKLAGYDKDAEKLFLENAFLRIRPVVRNLLFVCCLLVFLLLLFYPVDSVETGLKSVPPIMFLLFLLRTSAAEMDDSFSGIWKITDAEINHIYGADFLKLINQIKYAKNKKAFKRGSSDNSRSSAHTEKEWSNLH